MIAFLDGKVQWIESDSLVLNVNGVGYRVYTSNLLKPLNEPLQLYIYHQVREDAQLLFGFENQDELNIFHKLINVKGIGPKSAMNILGASSVERLSEAILAEDLAYIKKLPGIGPKSASQLILDLKGKLVDASKPGVVIKNQNLEDALDALKGLGYKASEVNSIAKSLASTPSASVNDYVKLGLNLLMKRKG